MFRLCGRPYAVGPPYPKGRVPRVQPGDACRDDVDLFRRQDRVRRGARVPHAGAAAVLIPTLIGVRLYGRVDGAIVRTIIMSILVASGIVLIAITLPGLV